MLAPIPPKSNLQRQRAFCKRNPHYYRDRTRRKKAQMEARLDAKAAVETVQEQSVTLLALPGPEAVATTTVTMTLPYAFLYEPGPIKIVPRK